MCRPSNFVFHRNRQFSSNLEKTLTCPGESTRSTQSESFNSEFRFFARFGDACHLGLRCVLICFSGGILSKAKFPGTNRYNRHFWNFRSLDKASPCRSLECHSRCPPVTWRRRGWKACFRSLNTSEMDEPLLPPVG